MLGGFGEYIIFSALKLLLMPFHVPNVLLF